MPDPSSANTVPDNSATLPREPAVPVAPAPVIAGPQHASGASSTAKSVVSGNARNREPRRKGLQASTGTISSAPAIYEAVSALPFHTVIRHQNSSFVPSFIAIATVIQHMNYQMAYTHRFLQGASAWQPFLTLTYYGVLFIIQSLRAAREIGEINDSQRWLLDGFERSYDFRSLTIAGPLVPYFQALAASSGPFERIGDLCPRIPQQFTANANHGFCIGNSLHRLLPNIPLYIDAIMKHLPVVPSSATASLSHQENFSQFIAHFWHTIHTTAPAGNAQDRLPMQSPGAWITPHFTYAQYGSAIGQSGHFGFPPALDSATGANITELAVFMRFYDNHGNFFNWFPNVASIMVRYNQFYAETVPMSAIPVTGIAAGLPVWTYNANTRLDAPSTRHAATAANAYPTWPAYRETHPLHSLSANGSHCDQDLEEVSEQASAVAQVNVDLVSHITNDVPTNANIRGNGPIWTLPSVREVSNVDYINSIGPILSARYHSDSRLH